MPSKGVVATGASPGLQLEHGVHLSSGIPQVAQQLLGDLGSPKPPPC